MTEPLSEHTADVIVVGAGPAGSTTAYYLAKAGLDVLLLEKTAFPREKVCGDGLTPRATKQLVAMGIDISEEAGWLRNKGLRIIGGGVRAPARLAGTRLLPGLRTRPQARRLRRAARPARPRRPAPGCTSAATSARRSSTTAPAASPACTRSSARRRRAVTFHAPLVVAADGNSTRLSLAMGLHRREDRPMGVAVRTYFTSPRHDDDYLESWLELWDRRGPGEDRLLPGYGWIFGMGDGTSNVGLGVLNTSAAFKELDWREVLKAWCASMPEDWGYTPENMTRPDPRRRPPDGLQPAAALHQGPAAGRRRGRPGQPVQRRGHRLRHGVRARSPPTSSSRPTPAPPRPSANWPCSATRRSSRTPTAATTRWAAPS